MNILRADSQVRVASSLLTMVVVAVSAACGGGGGGGSPDPGTQPGIGLAGNPDGMCAVPDEARAEDTSSPTRVIGDGTPASCTGAAVVEAVAQGGVITFECGPEPIIIRLDETAKVFNATGPKIVLDGGGKVTLSGQGARRILYMNTCDQAQGWTTDHCNNQDHPQLTVQNLTFVDGNASGDDPDGGGAIFVRGGRFKVVNSRFFNNVCDARGSDVGGGAIRVFDQFEGAPVFVVQSTFGDADAALGNRCANGGGLSSIGVSWTVLNSLFRRNETTGSGASDGEGGNGGAIYNDGNEMTLEVCGTLIEDNHANEGGGAIFFVSNNRTGHVIIRDSILRRNPSDGFETQGFPGMFVLAAEDPLIDNSTIE